MRETATLNTCNSVAETHKNIIFEVSVSFFFLVFYSFCQKVRSGPPLIGEKNQLLQGSVFVDLLGNDFAPPKVGPVLCSPDAVA